jgi:hypothetical protein
MNAGEIDTIGTAPLMVRLVESPLFARIMEDAFLETGDVTVSGSWPPSRWSWFFW